MQLLKKFITILVVLIIFCFLVANLIKNWHKIPFDSLHFNFINLFISFIFLFLNFLIFVEAWCKIIKKLGDRIDFKNAFWIMSASQTAKYLPGGIWFALGRIHLGRGSNMKSETIAISIVIETGLTIWVGILLFLLSVYFTGIKIFNNFLYLIPVFVFFIIILYPPLLNKLLNLALKIFNRPLISLSISYLSFLQLTVYFFGLWVTQIIGFYFLINSIYSIPILKIFNLSAAYTLSWLSGFIVIFAPGGLGVREGMMTLLLASFIPSPLAIAISFLSRVWITVFEIVIFFVGLIIHKFSAHR